MLCKFSDGVLDPESDRLDEVDNDAENGGDGCSDVPVVDHCDKKPYSLFNVRWVV